MRHRAFTLIELLAVVALVAILATLLVPRVTSTADSANARADEANRAAINSAVEQFHLATGNWPADDLSDIETNPSYFPEGVPVNPVTGSAYTLDPTTHRVSP